MMLDARNFDEMENLTLCARHFNVVNHLMALSQRISSHESTHWMYSAVLKYCVHSGGSR